MGMFVVLCVHPSAKESVAAYLAHQKEFVIEIEERRLNRLCIFSKNVAMHHLYNVLQPLAADEISQNSLEILKEVKF
jgi:hypothetical protein